MKANLDKNAKNVRNEKKKTFSPNAIEIELSKFLYSSILKFDPNRKKPNFQSWALYIHRLIRVDKRDPEEIKAVIEWLPTDDFWPRNILSAESLRKQFDRLVVKMRLAKAGHPELPELIKHARNILEIDGEEVCRQFCKENKIDFTEVRQ